MRIVRIFVVAIGFLAASLPLLWMGISSIKHRDATISQHPKIGRASCRERVCELV